MPATAYEIGINLASNAESVISTLDKVIAALGRVTKAQENAKIGFNDMVSSLRGAVRSANSLADAFQRMATGAAEAARASSRIRTPSGAGIGGGAAAAAAAASGAQANQFASGSRALVPMPAPFIPLPGGGGGRGLVPGGGGGLTTGSGAVVPGGIPLANISGLMGGGGGGSGGGAGGGGSRFRLPPLPGIGPYGTALAGYAGYHTIRDAYEQGADADDIIAKMVAMQVAGPNGQPTRAFTPQQIDQARNQAMATMRRVPGMGYSQALEVIGSTAGLLGDSREALTLAPQMSFNAQVLSRYGKGDAIKQIEDAVQAGELTGLTGKDGKINTDRLTDFINRLTRTAVAMGGNLDISKYLTGLRQFGTGASAADLDFTTATLPAYMKIMGNARAGTALTSLQQVLMAPVPNTRSNRYQEEQERIGLRDRQGNLRDRETLQADPQAYFINTVLPAFTKAGFVTPKQITDEIQKIFPRQTVDRLASAGIADRGLIEKEVQRNLAQQRAGDAPLSSMLASAPGNQFKAFTESFKALEAVTTDATMGPALDILKLLTGAFQNMTDYVKAHPNDARMFAQDVDDIVQALVKAAKVVGFAWKLLPDDLKGAAAGAIVGGAVGSVVPGVGTGAGALVGGVLGLGNRMTALPPPPPGYHRNGYGFVVRDAAPAAPAAPASSSAGPIQKTAYIEGGAEGHTLPVNVTLQIDGRTLAQVMTKHQVQQMRPSVQQGMNDPDYSMMPMPAGLRAI